MVCFIIFQTVLSHVVTYHEEHHLFLYSMEYLRHTWHWAGAATVAAAFLVQFFYYPWLGSLLLATWLSGLFLISHRGMTGLTGRKDLFLLSLLPPFAALLYLRSVSHSLSTLVSVTVCLAAAVELLLRLRRRWLGPDGRLPLFSAIRPLQVHPAVSWLCVLAYTAGGYVLFWTDYPYHERRLCVVSHCAGKGQWEQVLRYTSSYFQSGRTNNMMAYYHNLGLYHTGQLPARVLQYNRPLGAKGLSLAWKGSRDDAEYGALLYEQLGLLNIAHRWESEALVKYGETAPHLLRLSRYNIALRRPQVALRFLRKLRQSLFYAAEADRLASQVTDPASVGLHDAFRGQTDHRFFDATDLFPNLEPLLQADPDNRMAYEYLLCASLLSHDLDTFARWYGQAGRFYSEVPAVFRQTMEYCQKGGSHD